MKEEYSSAILATISTLYIYITVIVFLTLHICNYGPGSNPGGDEIFRPSRPALGPTQPPLK